MSQTIGYNVTGEQTLHCAGCEQRVATALRHVRGVEDVQADSQTQRIVVTLDPAQVAPKQIEAKLVQMGYEVTPAAQPQTDRSVIAEETHPPDGVVRSMGTAKLQMKVGGMHCSLCTSSIHKTLNRLDGVQAVQVSIAHQETLVQYDPTRVSAEAHTTA